MSFATLACAVPNQFVEVDGRRLAYRVIGDGKPLVLCLRFRGIMDDWDPAFLDALAAQGFRIYIFDYSGLGLSTGLPTYDPASLAKDAIDLLGALKLDRVVLGGWSIGGVAAQLVLLQAPQLLSHLLLIATTPPGQLVKTGEPFFYQLAARENDFEDFVSLFFEPTSETSREAAVRSAERIALRSEGRSPPVPYTWAAESLGDGPRNPMFPAQVMLDVLKQTKTPVLHLGGDHDIVFPVENWYALNRTLPTLHLLTLPSSGHGPQNQYPIASAAHIAAFVSG
ncbi:alpha/beta fold hydrolase [Pseudomonas fluorescens]|uniref:Alpha/beta hydrolase n=1 Tax=Pseudomonas fluorescens TaxID=294 RepID=A0A944DL93_PSEFL|nr:alpha/beta hydrolase [Pseudomonas fluorescens]MBT2298131.1 alpha/beta hydrolase [Pseudomonas fluorescens]MBT2309746.1 alpha/beta hydrolase [Pseudomonas fluorescens]MBT2314909.1 alpha/beta hydrolase [Pseudomonas fluorescens]MBT2327815.1 alpha/beta hydrolase [Pseudomonas fluorescens]MBT2345562.1 alpha/beta hydrolase [Pseudomonas fluorescens]